MNRSVAFPIAQRVCKAVFGGCPQVVVTTLVAFCNSRILADREPAQVEAILASALRSSFASLKAGFKGTTVDPVACIPFLMIDVSEAVDVVYRQERDAEIQAQREADAKRVAEEETNAGRAAAEALAAAKAAEGRGAATADYYEFGRQAFAEGEPEPAASEWSPAFVSGWHDAKAEKEAALAAEAEAALTADAALEAEQARQLAEAGAAPPAPAPTEKKIRGRKASE